MKARFSYIAAFSIFLNARFAYGQADGTAESGLTRPATPASSHVMGPGAYPWLSTVLGEQGDTTLGFTILPDGSVADVHVVQSSGSSRLDGAAVEGAKTWRYNPAVQNGKPISVPWETKVAWRLATDTSQLALAGFPVVRATRGDFPADALKGGESGTTIVGLRVSPAGQIVGAEVYRSSGHDDLDAAAVRLALSKIRAKPGEVDGKPVMTMVPLFVVWMPDDAATASK